MYYKACILVLREFEKINGEFAAIGLVKISFLAEEIFVEKLKENQIFEKEYR